MLLKRVLLLVLTGAAAWCQKPVIFPGGFVNAASYAPASSADYGGIVSIFGENLAASTASAQAVPLPTKLAGTSVTVDGILAPLFYVSPGQINFQYPSSVNTTAGSAPVIVVSTAAGSSDPYLTAPTPEESIGIFSTNSTGCGQGAVLNVASDGTVSANSASNSVSPGDYVSIYGTGLEPYYTNLLQDGVPTPLDAPPRVQEGVAADFDFILAPYSLASWAGRAPGLIGVDQVNIQIPAGAREGCAVPLRIVTSTVSQPVTISIHSGGGACSDPPSAGYAQITWEKSITTTALYSTSETDTLTGSLQSSPGKQTPTPPTLTEGIGHITNEQFGPSCAVPGYRSLDAGAITGQVPGMGQIQTSTVPLTPSPISGLTVYQANLPAGTIQPGKFEVSGSGGPDVGAFTSSIQIGSPITIESALPGLVVRNDQPFTVYWSGGDPGTWVALSLVSHDPYNPIDVIRTDYARTTDGSITMSPAGGPPASMGIPTGPIEIIVRVFPDPSEVQPFSAPGLSLGGVQTWEYTYRFEGAMLQ
jgi:uncharacterized protein (TIGR03437 family)